MIGLQQELASGSAGRAFKSDMFSSFTVINLHSLQSGQR